MSSEISPCPSASASALLSTNSRQGLDKASPSQASIARLRPYHREVALAILDSVFSRKRLTFSVEIARQGCKNELSAQLDPPLFTLHITEPKNLVKCSPTFKPQTVISIMRLKDRLNDAGFNGIWVAKLGFRLLATVNSGRLKMYLGDGSPEYQEFWLELERAQSHYRPNQTMNFYVDPTRGHDDFLMSLALLVEAANQYSPPQCQK